MNTMNRTPLRGCPSPVERDSAGGASSTVRAPLPFPEPRNHGEEIRNILAERDAETHVYDCPANDPRMPALTPEQSARMVQYVERLSDEDDRWPAGWWIAPGVVVVLALMWGIFG